MKPFFTTHTCFFVLFSLILFGCIDDNDIQETDLLGRWEISSAFRNGEETESMMGLYFHFGKDSQLLTNMTGAVETYEFSIEDETIIQRKGRIDADYFVELLTADSLILLTTLRSKEFKMILSKKN